MKEQEIVEILSQIPDTWTAGLVRVKNKKPIDKGFNSVAAGRWEHGAPDNWRAQIVQHLTQAGGVGVGLVPPPGVVCVDCDNTQAIEWADSYSQPETPWMVRTADSAHAWFSYELPHNVEDWLSKGVELENGAKLDLRVAGKSQAVVPPSRHSSGVHPRWETPLPKHPFEIPRMPEEMMQTLMEAGLVPNSERLSVPDGANAHDTVRDWIFARVDTADSLEDLTNMARRFAEYYVNPMRPDRFRQMIGGREFPDLVNGAWEQRGQRQLPRMIQAGIGDDRYVYFWNREFPEKWIHVGEWSPDGVWLYWDKESWKYRSQLGDEGFHGALQRYTRRLKYLRDHDSPLVADHLSFTQMLDGMRGELSRARSAASPIKRLTEALSTPGESFDTRPHLWTCPKWADVENPHPPMTINFETQEVKPPDPDDRITRIGGAPFIPGKKSKLWLEFVEEAFPDPYIRRFIQVATGYCLLGDPNQDVVIFLIGRGGSGKSTFIRTLEKMFGDYAGVVPPVEIDDKMPGSSAGGTNASLLALRGKRIATCTELSDKVRLGAKLKGLTGGDTQSGRGLYSRIVTAFTPRFVVWLGGNLQPEAKAVDTGLTRRMRYVPMESQPTKINRDLRAQLQAPEELAGVFNWALAGLQMFFTDGRTLIVPEAIEQRSQQARREASDIGPWMHDRVIEDDDADGFTPSEGYDKYVEWWMEVNGTRRGLPVRNVSRFGEEMAALGYRSQRVRSKQDKKVRRVFSHLRVMTTRERLDREDGL
jgi:P4 family phage/plasmid primase-like protien